MPKMILSVVATRHLMLKEVFIIFFEVIRNVFRIGALALCGCLMATVTTNSTMQIHRAGLTIKSSCCRLPRGWDRIGYGRFCGYLFGGTWNGNSPETIKSEGMATLLLEGPKRLTFQRRSSYSTLWMFETESLWLERNSRRLARVELTSREIPLSDIDGQVANVKDAVDYHLALKLVPVQSCEKDRKMDYDRQIAQYEVEDPAFKVDLVVFKTTNSTAKMMLAVTSKRVLINPPRKPVAASPSPLNSDLQVECEGL